MRRIGTATATMMEWLNRQAEVALCRKLNMYVSKLKQNSARLIQLLRILI